MEIDFMSIMIYCLWFHKITQYYLILIFLSSLIVQYS